MSREQKDVGPDIAVVPDVTSQHESGDTESQSVPADVRSSSTGDDVSLYQLKWIEWRGDFAPIVTQNENGPCPLLAICNVLILNGQMKIPPGETLVTSTHLLDLLGASLIESHPGDTLSDGERANYEQNVQDAMSIFPKLQTGLDVNVKFNSVSGFEFTSESGLFDLLDVQLYHGWLVDPQEAEISEVIGHHSYNQLVEMIVNSKSSDDQEKISRGLVAEQFLETTASQLTYHGVFELNKAVSEGQLCVFFRNNHFSTLLKRKGELLLLVTDHGFLNEHDHIWQTLSDIDGDGDFLDANFQWSSHSERQRDRVEGVTKGTDQHHAEHTHVQDQTIPSHPDVDYQTALSLQQEEYQQQQQQQQGSHVQSKSSQEQADRDLAAQLQQADEAVSMAPPTTPEEYERAAVEYHHRTQSQKDPSCIVL